MSLRQTGLLLGLSWPLVVVACADDPKTAGDSGLAGSMGEGGSGDGGASPVQGGSANAAGQGASAAGTAGEEAGGAASSGAPAGGSPSEAGAGGESSLGGAGMGGAPAVCGDFDLADGAVCFDAPYDIAAEQGQVAAFVFTQWQGETGADLAILSSDSTLWWYSTYENGHFGPATPLGDVTGTAGIVLAAGRLDGGPGPDLIAGGDTSTMDIFFGTNAGDVAETQLLSGEGTATALFVADLPGSPAGQDLVSVRDGYAFLHVTSGSSDAGWLDETVALHSGGPLAGDGVLAQLDASSLSLVVSRLDQPMLARAQVIWGSAVTLGPLGVAALEAPANALDVGDFDEDGNQDIVASLIGPTHVNVLFGDGEGGFRVVAGNSYESVEAGPWLQDVKVGDFNGDGHDDIAASSRQADAVVIVLGDGRGGFADPEFLQLGSGTDPAQLEVSDLDEDEVDDIAVRTRDSLKILLSNP